ncbi:hypothetical protein [Natrialba sp. SSL1]|uniref:hypothetical protein n=1 Tax=Natrialba sp. SSL1 TaxID=1869245 RepID=UPI001495AC56|nr:hypothetical protein [Natrialba sp. SSL1]
MCDHIPLFDAVKYVLSDQDFLPVRCVVKDEFGEVFFQVRDVVEEIDAGGSGVEIGVSEDTDDVVYSASGR